MIGLWLARFVWVLIVLLVSWPLVRDLAALGGMARFPGPTQKELVRRINWDMLYVIALLLGSALGTFVLR
jgi:hypothetical protein